MCLCKQLAHPYFNSSLVSQSISFSPFCAGQINVLSQGRKKKNCDSSSAINFRPFNPSCSNRLHSHGTFVLVHHRLSSTCPGPQAVFAIPLFQEHLHYLLELKSRDTFLIHSFLFLLTAVTFLGLNTCKRYLIDL